MAFSSSPSPKKPSNSNTGVIRRWRDLHWWWRRLWSTSKNKGDRTVDEFEVKGKLGEGSFGVVYKARDRRTGQVIAMKKFRRDAGDDKRLGEEPEEKEQMKKYQAEIEYMTLCRHPSIVELKEVVLADDRMSPVMIMEFAGGELRNHLSMFVGWLSEGEAKFLMHQLLQGVKCLHDNRIIHRDLKTSNLLVGKNQKLKICDFGLACRCSEAGKRVRHDGKDIGTLWYRAPELLMRRTREYTAAVDMWAVGCIMAEILTKNQLFEGASKEHQLQKIIEVLGKMNLEADGRKVQCRPCSGGGDECLKDYLWPSTEVSSSGLDLLRRLLAYDPEKRITVDEALCHPWFGSLRR